MNDKPTLLYDDIPHSGPLRAVEFRYGGFPVGESSAPPIYRLVRRVPDEFIDEYAAHVVEHHQLDGEDCDYVADRTSYAWVQTTRLGAAVLVQSYCIVTLSDAKQFCYVNRPEAVTA